MILDELIDRIISLGKAKRKKSCPQSAESAVATESME